MPKHLNILIFFVYSLILACFFQGHTAKDISAVADRYCQPLGHGKELRLESCPFSRVLRLKGCLTAGGGPITHPAPLAPSPLLKKKGDICYFTIPPGKGGSLDLSAETAGTAQACVYNYFSRSKGVYVALFNDYPDIAPVHPLGGYFLFFSAADFSFFVRVIRQCRRLFFVHGACGNPGFSPYLYPAAFGDKSLPGFSGIRQINGFFFFSRPGLSTAKKSQNGLGFFIKAGRLACSLYKRRLSLGPWDNRSGRGFLLAHVLPPVPP